MSDGVRESRKRADGLGSAKDIIAGGAKPRPLMGQETHAD